LDREAYIGKRTYHITLTTTERAPFFEHLDHALSAQRALVETAAKLRFRVFAYCFMPDHLHVLLQGETHQSDLMRFVQRFKQVTSFHFKQLAAVPLWQQSFYDRVLRKGDDVAAIARYVLDNPVSEGLAAGSPAYHLRGGEYDLREVGSDGAKASSLRGLSSVEGMASPLSRSHHDD
jgi:putative transposase